MSIREKVILEGDDQVTPAARSASQSVNQFDEALKRFAVAGGLALAVNKIRELTVASATMAIDAGEAASAFATTFGDALPQASAFVEDFANMAGFADHELQQMLATTGAVVQGIGATEAESAMLAETMARLAGDVASFSNAQGGAEAVMLALQSAINGEREALKTYGLAVSEAEVQQRALMMTGKAHADELTRLEKAYATVEIATDKAGKMVGDLERTQDSTANSLRSLAATGREAAVVFGETLIPIIDELIPTAEATIPALGRLGNALTNALGQPVTESAETLPRIADGLSVVMNSIVATGAGALTMLGELGDEINILGLKEPSSQMLLDLQANAEAMNDIIRIAENLRNGDLGQDPLGLANAMAFLNSEGNLTVGTLEELVRMFDLTEFQTALAAQALVDAGMVTGDVATELEGYVTTQQERLQADRDAAETARMTREAMRGQQGAIEETTAEVDAYTAAVGDAIAAGDTWHQAILEGIDPVFNAIGAFQDLRDTLADVNEDGEITGDEFVDLARSQLELDAALSQVDPSEYEAFMETIQRTTGDSREEVAAFLDDLGLIDGRTFSATVDVAINGVGTNRGGLQTRHQGGFAPDGEYATVLQRGELVIPTSGSDRESFRDLVMDLTAQMRLANPTGGRGDPGAGGGVNINVNVYGDDAPTAAASLQSSTLIADLERIARDLTTWEPVS